jgi:hypothetical protein
MNLDQAIKLLTKARDLITPKGVWIKKLLAADNVGRPVGINSPYACSFCASGAMIRVNQNPKNDKPRHELNASLAFWALSDTMSRHGIVSINDVPGANDARGTTHMQVLNAFDFAILDLKNRKRIISRIKRQAAAQAA